MVLIARLSLLLAVVGGSPLGATLAGGGEPLSSADSRVMLPLADYLGLTARVEAVARRERDAGSLAPNPLFESERLSLVAEKKSVRADYELTVRIESAPAVLALPLPGLVIESRVAPEGAAIGRGDGGRPTLYVERSGRYRLSAASIVLLIDDAGRSRLDLPTPLSPVASVAVDLPEESAYELAGARLATEAVDGGRRRLELAPVKGQTVQVTLRRAGADAEEELVARATTLVLLEARSDGLARRDAVLYEVERGGLTELALRAPAGLAAREVATDEGTVLTARDGDRLLVRRERRLADTGFVVATSSADARAPLSLSSFEPAVDVRARYVAFAARNAARFELTSPASWQRIDLTDLPKALAERITSSALGSAYRFVGHDGEEGSARVVDLPPAETASRLVARRETTTLLTAEGRVVHRDRLVLPPEAGEIALELAPGAELWSARVANESVRPLGEGRHWVVPLLAAGPGGAPTVAEIVTLSPPVAGRPAEIDFALPVIAGTVVEHRWRIVLPDGRRYRLLDSELSAAGRTRAGARGEFGGAGTAVASNVSGASSAFGSAPDRGGSLFGTVLDDKGLALPGVTTTLTGGTQTLVVKTDAQGAFAFHRLSAGAYRIEAELEGFSPVVYEKVIITGGGNTALALTMNAAVSETITITAESPLLDARRMTTGMTVGGSELGSGGGYDFGSRRNRRTDSSRSRTRGELPPGELERELQELQAGLVGGVRPIAVELPEKGKLFALVGVLPPGLVTARFETRRER